MIDTHDQQKSLKILIGSLNWINDDTKTPINNHRYHYQH